MDVLSLRNAIPDRIETARLVLRTPDRRDVDAMTALANNPAIHAMTVLPFPYRRPDAIAFVDTIARTDHELAYSIVLPIGTFIGAIALHLSKDAPPALGYWIGEPFWGRGYGTEAARALVDAATATGHCPVIAARTRAENTKSRHLLEKLGFVLAGEAIADCGPHKGTMVASYRLGQEALSHA